MHPELMLLLEIQDLRSQRRELAASPDGVEVEHFNIDLDRAVGQLEGKIAELEEQLSPPVRSRYRRVSPTLDRVVVPVISGVCYGCFVSVATARAGEQDPNQSLSTCETCGRFLYFA